MEKTRENLLATVVSVVILTLTVTGAGYGVESQYNLAISPQNPSPSNIVEITLSGEWNDACVPNRSSISVVGHDIYFDAILDYYWPDIGCAAVISGWTLTENVGPLSPGTYTVYASIPGYSPHTQVGTFDVTEQGNGNNTTAGPVAHWKFDEDAGTIAHDSAGTNNGTLVNGAQWTIGVIGGTLEFDGVDDYVALPHNAVTTTEFTVAGWSNMFGLAGGASNYNAIFQQNEDQAGDNNSLIMLMAERDNSVMTHIRSSIGSVQTLSYPRMNYNEWHHYAITVGSIDLILYVDGNEVDRTTNNQSGNYTTSIDYVAIGRLHSNGEDKGFFNGTIDDVRIYDRALSAQEIEELYTPDIGGLIAHWKFDEGEGDTAYDSAGTNHGTISGAQWTTGTIGGALEFDGVDDYVALSDNNPVWLPQNNFAFSLWVYFFNDAPILENLLDMDGAGSGSSSNRLGYGIFRQEEGKCHFSMVSGDGYSDILLSNTVLLKENWYHLVALRNGTTQSIYINGQLDSSKNCSSDPIDFDGNYNDDKVNIGRASRSGRSGDITGSYINGLIDDVQIYDRALSAGEIQELYEQAPVVISTTWHVDAVHGSDANDGLSKFTPFATINQGIEAAEDGDTVLVWPGVYTEEVRFRKKAVTVRSAADAALIQNPDDFAVSFYYGEGRRSVLKNFVIANSLTGIFIAASSPTISNVTVVNNAFGIEAYADAEPDITNSILWNNEISDLYGCEARQSWVQKEPIPEAPPDGLISHWAFDEGEGDTAYDSAGSNHGTLINGPTWTTGQIDGALDFDGVDDYVEVSSSNELKLNLAGAISVWIYPNSLYERSIVSKRGGSHGGNKNENYWLAIGSYSVCAIVIGDGTNYVQASIPTTELNVNSWQHIVGTWNPSEISIYLDGELKDVQPNTLSSLIRSDTYPLRIGYDSRAYWHFDGLIDDVRIYDRDLSAQEIEQLYRGAGDTDPLFADTEYGDYHLKSERGRYWPEHNIWVLDEVTSPCIDAGDPDADFSAERNPNGGRINIGAYGGTYYASMSLWWPCGDVNRDGKVNWEDFAIIAENWLVCRPGGSEQPALPGPPTNPDPYNGAAGVSTSPVLSWQPGAGAMSHGVYFGDTPPGVFQGNQPGTTFNLSGLSNSTTYYWRITENNAHGRTPGPIWTFTTTNGGWPIR